MTVGTAWPYNSAACDRARFLPAAIPQRVLGGAALTCVAITCAWSICAHMTGSGSSDNGVATRSDPLSFAASRGDRLNVESMPGPASASTGTMNFDSRFAAAFPPGVYLGSRSFASDSVAEAEPPAPVAQDLARAPRIADNTPASTPLSLAPRARRHALPRLAEIEQQPETVASAEPEKPSLFQRLFGAPAPSIFEKLFGPSKATLAYASSEDGVASDGASITSGLYDRQTAVYDISTHTVYLPNGTALEAHSGLGPKLDDPRYVADRDVGATPPDVYDLRPRERLFHGVQALRLIPVDEKKVFGRAGLLAHSYMLGPNGQSNGCVSFKHYNAFLEAYENHEITRLAVVSHL
jgi:Protein of unknown function (DUF2778)